MLLESSRHPEAGVRKGGANVLIMENDLEIDPGIAASTGPASETLGREAWESAHLGQILGDDPGGVAPMAPHQGRTQTTHFIDVVPRMVDYLEQDLRHPPGHPEGGPMDVDGAYSCFKARCPDVTRSTGSSAPVT